MAITITNEPTGLYPCYNDAWFQFTSDLADQTHAEIIVSPIEQYPRFKLYAIDGVFTFNLKEVVKTKFPKTFDDKLAYNSNWGYTYPYHITLLTFQVFVKSPDATDNLTKNIEFYRGAKQINEPIFDNSLQLLSPSTNGVDYSLSYWEGYPFDFSLHKAGNQVRVKNVNSGVLSNYMYPTSTNMFRVVVDKATDNWTSSEFLALNDNLNRLEIYQFSTFKTNVNLKKVSDKCGVYVKWFNNQGGYSYHLFDEYYTDGIKGKSIGTVNNNQFQNVGSGRSKETKSLGFDGTGTMQIKTTADRNESEVLKSLSTSPYVQVWSAQKPNQVGKWIDVDCDFDYKKPTKKEYEQFTATLTLPKLVTPAL